MFLVFEHKEQIGTGEMEYMKHLKEALRLGVSLETFNHFWEMDVNTKCMNADKKFKESSQSGSSGTHLRNERELSEYINDRFSHLQQQLLEQQELLLTMFTAIQEINQKIDSNNTFYQGSKERTNQQNVGYGLTFTYIDESIPQKTVNLNRQPNTSKEKSDRTLDNSGATPEQDLRDVGIISTPTTQREGEICSNRIELAQHRIVDDGMRQHQIFEDVIQGREQKITIDQSLTVQDTTDDITRYRSGLKSRRKMISPKPIPDFDNKNTNDPHSNQSQQQNDAMILEGAEDQRGQEPSDATVSSTRATGTYAEAIAKQLSARGRNNVLSKYIPRSGVYFEIDDAIKLATEKRKIYTDCYLAAQTSCAVRMMFSFDESSRLVVTLLVSRSPDDDSSWPVYISGEGEIFNFFSKRYTRLWWINSQRFDKPGDDMEVPFQVKTCLETPEGPLPDVTYEQLYKRNHEKSNKINIHWKLEAHHRN